MTIYTIQVSVFFPEKIDWIKAKNIKHWGDGFFITTQRKKCFHINIKELNKVKIDNIYQYAEISFIDGKNIKKYVTALTKKAQRIFNGNKQTT